MLDQLERISVFLKEANDDREERLRQIVRLTEHLRQAGEYQERLHGDVSLLLEQRKALEEALVKLSAVLSSPLVRFLQTVHLVRGAPDSWQRLVESCKEKQ